MELKTFIAISPKAVEAGTEPGSKGWAITGAHTALPTGLPPLTKVLELTIVVPDGEWDLPKTKVKWPTGEPDPEVVAELKGWTAPS